MNYIPTQEQLEMLHIPTQEQLVMLRKQYPVGSRILLEHMSDDDPNPVTPNTKGTVVLVDDAGTIHCDFDDGRRIGVIPGVDSFRTLTASELSDELGQPGL